MGRSARGPLLAAAACFLAFGIVLACAYAIAPIERWDATALHGLRGLNSYDVGEPLAHAADPLPIVLALAALLAWGWSLGRRREALAALALVVGANLIGLALKTALAHPRYHAILGSNQVGADAYPSGHATSAMSIALAAVLVAPARLRVAVACGAAVYVIAVSASMLVLGWHFPSDVLGGLLISSGFFFLTVAALRVGTANRAGAAAQRVGVALSPWLGAVAALLAGAGVVALSGAGDLLSFASLNTVAVVAAFAVVAVAAGLVASATVISDP